MNKPNGNTNSLRAYAVIIFLLFWFGASLFYFIYWTFHIKSLFKKGVYTKGVVTKYEEVKSEGVVLCLYTIRYIHLDRDKRTINLDLGRNYARVGDTLQIMYFPDDPYGAHVVDEKFHYKKGTMFVIISLFALVTAGLVWCLFHMDKVQYFLDNYIVSD